MLAADVSILVPWVPLAPAVAGILVFALGRLGRVSREGLALAGAASAFGLAIAVGLGVAASGPVAALGRQLYVDALGAVMLVLVSGVALVATVYAAGYMGHSVGPAGQPHTTTAPRLTAFYGGLMLFLSTMLWACVANDVIVLYVAVEASTLASGLLVAFYGDRRALEAGYKYLLLLTVGITFALFGCVLLYVNGAPSLGGARGLLLTELRDVVARFPAGTAALTSAFLVVGFGTKAGLAPFHPWLPDAHAEAPTPVSAMLSGVMLKVALYALVRTVSPFFPPFPPVASFVLGLAIFTLVSGDLMALAQTDLKRMLAYSSVSQVGYVLLGFALATPLGVTAGLFHLVNHALAKALLFLSAGAVIYATGARGLRDLGGLAKRMPVTCLCFTVGALALAGVPPLNGFQSKLALMVAGAGAGQWWAVVFGLAASLVTLLVFARAVRMVFWGAERPAFAAVREVPAALQGAMLVLAALCVLLGVAPGLVYDPLLAATSALERGRVPAAFAAAAPPRAALRSDLRVPPPSAQSAAALPARGAGAGSPPR